MTPIIMLHGAIGSAIQMQPFADALKDLVDVQIFNFPGHGGKKFKAAFSIQEFTGELYEYIQQHQFEKVNLFGFSMGGYVAMNFAYRYPSLVEKVCTLGTKYYWDDEIAIREATKLVPAVIKEKIPAYAQTLIQLHGETNWEKLLISTALLLKDLGRDPILNKGVYAKINQPCLIMLGDSDKMVSLEETIFAFRNLAQASLAVLPGTIHQVEKIDQQLVTLYLKKFFLG